jgi:hypothetical protein
LHNIQSNDISRIFPKQELLCILVGGVKTFLFQVLPRIASNLPRSERQAKRPKAHVHHATYTRHWACAFGRFARRSDSAQLQLIEARKPISLLFFDIRIAYQNDKNI